MDHQRYMAYRSLEQALDETPPWQLDPHERERLRDTAEALLLTRADSDDDAERLRRDAALALSMLVGQRRCDDARADRLWEAICGCGPAGAIAGGRRRRESVFVRSI